MYCITWDPDGSALLPAECRKVRSPHHPGSRIQEKCPKHKGLNWTWIPRPNKIYTPFKKCTTTKKYLPPRFCQKKSFELIFFLYLIDPSRLGPNRFFFFLLSLHLIWWLWSVSFPHPRRRNTPGSSPSPAEGPLVLTDISWVELQKCISQVSSAISYASFDTSNDLT